MQARGFKSTGLLLPESTYGTLPAAGVLLPFNSDQLKATRQRTPSQTIGYGRRDPQDSIEGMTDVKGQIVVPLDLLNTGHWLRAMFGAPTTTGGGPYAHVFKTVADQPSFSWERKVIATATKYWQYTGCKIAKASFDFGADGEVVLTLDIIGSAEAVADASADSDATIAAFTRFARHQCTVSEGGSAFAKATAFTLDIDFGLDEQAGRVINGGTTLADLPEGIMAISGKFTALADTTGSIVDKVLAGTESSLIGTWTNGTASLAIKLPEVRYAKDAIVIPGPKGLLIDTTFQAYYDNNADTTAVVATLTNAQASYA